MSQSLFHINASKPGAHVTLANTSHLRTRHTAGRRPGGGDVTVGGGQARDTPRLSQFQVGPQRTALAEGRSGEKRGGSSAVPGGGVRGFDASCDRLRVGAALTAGGALASREPLNASIPLAGGERGREHERGHTGGRREATTGAWGPQRCRGAFPEPQRRNAVL